MTSIKDLIKDAESHDEPETTDKPHEDKKHVPEHVDIEDHTREDE